MKNRNQKEIRSKAKLTYGLLNILKDDIDNLRMDANANDLENLSESLYEAMCTLQKLMDVMSDIEYALYLEKAQESL